MTSNLVQIPWGVEAVWCILTAKNVTNDSKIQKIACCAFYSKPCSKKKTLFLDHISDAYIITHLAQIMGVGFILFWLETQMI